MSELADAVQGWDPPPQTTRDELRRCPVDALCALLDQPPLESDALPPLWHWLFFLDHPRTDELGADGHIASGHFLPPIPRRRRMFAGGRVQFRRSLRLGTSVRRTSRITAVTPKTGRSGEMLFVTERREFADDDGIAIVEDQDVVYRQAPLDRDQPASPPALPATPSDLPSDGRVGILPDAPFLFRYSALTYNAHRIHHDGDYAREVEGYPGLVVQGPLLAMLLLEPVRRAKHSSHVAGFAFQLRRPAFVGTALVVGDDGAEVAVGPVDGPPTATGSITFR